MLSALSISSYRGAIACYIVLMGLLFAVFVRDVVAPHRQQHEIGLTEVSASGTLENRKFNDYALAYVPEVSEHMTGLRSGWLTLWTTQSELGRPLYHLSAFSSAYPLAWLAAKLTSSPWRFITLISLSFCFLAGFFIVMFAREFGKDPAAALVGGVSYAAAPLMMYWLSFPMFPAVWCWAAGALWGLARLAHKRDLLAWSVLSFSGYSALMTGYPQPIVFKIYLLAGFGLWLFVQIGKADWREATRFALHCTTAMLVAAALALPVYVDIAITASESTRLQADAAFFTAALPTINGFEGGVKLLVSTLFPELLGNPIAPQFPWPYNGHSMTALAAVFVLVGGVTVFRETWGWWLAVVLLLMLAFVHPLYAFGVNYLGFHLSRSTPLGSLLLPMTVILVWSVDAALRRGHSIRVVMLGALATVTLCLLAAALYVVALGLPARWIFIGVTLAILGLLVPYRVELHRLRLLLALSLTLVSTAYPLMIRQHPDEIAVSSALVETVRDALPQGSRYLVATPGIPVFPPNLNVGLGLPSVHSYNSLSSMRYHELIESLGGQMNTYGRWNADVSPDYSSPAFWMSNVGLVLSSAKIAHSNLVHLGHEAGVNLYRVETRMGEGLQVLWESDETVTEAVDVGDPRDRATRASVKIHDRGDVLEYETQADQPSVLVLSQKYHRDWRASALVAGKWTPAPTLPVNGAFQGVWVAASTERIRLEFAPYARFAWIAYL